MKKRYSTGMILAAAVLSLSFAMTGCGTKAPEVTPGKTEDYKSADGWSVTYDSGLFQKNETDAHTVSFVYMGESAGTNMVTISFEEGKQPEEAMSEITEDWDPEKESRFEGIFPGTDDKWGYWRVMGTEEKGSQLSETVIGGEYNGGALIFDLMTHIVGEEEASILASDELSAIIDSIQYESFEPQTMYSYYPGTYVLVEEETGNTSTVILNEDHTGTLDFQDTIEVMWGSASLIRSDGGGEYEFTIEGDSLYLDQDGEWLTFERELT